MNLAARYEDAKRDELVARLRRVVSLRAMVASGMSQRAIADDLGISQPAVSQQLKATPDLQHVHPEILIEAAAPVLKHVAHEHGYRELAVFGSVARHEATPTSDIDLLVRAPKDTSTFDFLKFKSLLEESLGRSIDLVEYGGLKPGIDDDIRSDAVML